MSEKEKQGLLQLFQIPAAELASDGSVKNANEYLDNFLQYKIKKGDNLIRLLKKKALK